MRRILVIDDDDETNAHLTLLLRSTGFTVDIDAEIACGGDADLEGRYALIIVDVMTRRFDGFEGLRRLCDANPVPVLVLTACGAESDRVTGLESGADDYVVKPFRPREVAARVRALLRRANTVPVHEHSAQRLHSGRLTLWPAQRRAEWCGSALRLTSTEFSLLELLMRRAGSLVSKAELSTHALGRPPARYERSIDTHVCSLRRKLPSLPDGRSPIQTVHLRGYQLLAE